MAIRIFIAGLFVLAAAFCNVRPGYASTELCGAEPQTLLRISPTTYGYVLSGLAPRMVTGHLGIYSGSTSGFLVAFSNVALTRTEHQIFRKDGQPYMKYVDYESRPLFFELPSAQTVTDVWVDDVDFTDHPHAGCLISPLDVDNVSGDFTDKGGPSPDDIRKAVPQTFPVALPREMPSAGTCGKRYVPVSISAAPRVSYPQGLVDSYTGPVNVVSKVLVDKDGSVIDAWLFGGSGTGAFDRPGVRAASEAKYAPAQFLCKPIPALILYIQAFNL